jgi:hypothetical protein
MTLEEQLAGLLAEDETVAKDADGQRRIYRGQELVGYIVVLSNE